MFKKSFQKIFLTAAVGILLLAPAAMAAEILPACAKAGDCQLNDMVQVIVNVSDWILSIVGSVALLFFVYGGFVFIFSGGSEEKVKQGKQILIGSIIGLFIVFGSFLIIKYAEKFLGAEGADKNTNSVRVEIK
jgi:hypothetical protein